MADIPLPPDLPSLLADYERRLRALETRPQIPRRADFNVPTYPTISRSNTSWQVFTGYEVTATIGPSRQALVTVSCDMGLNQPNQTGYLGFYDGVNFRFSAWMSITSGVGTVYTAGTIGIPRLSSNLPTGDVTFTVAGFVSAGSVNYTNVSIVVQPY